MITEDYCSYEVAKLLQEKGFNEPVTELNRLLFKEGKKPVLKITLQKAMKWLRNTFHLEIYPFHDAIQENNDWWYRIEHYSKGCSLTEHESDVIYKTYEQACEAAIKYCLEHLI